MRDSYWKAETDVSQTAEPLSSASDSVESAVSEEYEMFSVEHLKSTKYYQKVMDWFDEKNFSDEERQRLLNDPEFIKDAMRDSYWKAETDVSQTAEPLSSASDSGESAVSEEYEMFSVEHLKSTKYYQKVMDWFDEKNFSDEERQRLLNDPEFIKDAMRDSYWNY